MTSLTSTLTVDLGALTANWRALDALSAPECETAAVVKGDGYGCGAAEVGRALAAAGVRTFFVALPAEGACLRPAIGPDPAIYVLGGYATDEAAEYRAYDLRPVLNSAAQATAWFGDHPGRPAAVQIDTGMNRLGMEPGELQALGPLPDNVDLMMSHMGNADMPGDPLNRAQREVFRSVARGRRSLSATAGTVLGPDWHFDMNRVGIGLYGGLPFAEGRPVIRVDAPVIQVRDLVPGEIVGYGATWRATQASRIATLSVGYADGLLRALGTWKTSVYLRGEPRPLAGRVSMDLITIDVTGTDCAAGDRMELIGPNQSIDTLAEAAGTIGHEILTSLGPRYRRHYLYST